MSVMIVICIFFAAVLVTAVVVYFLLKQQNNAVMDEVKRLSLRLRDIEMKEQPLSNLPEESHPLQQQQQIVPKEEVEEQEVSQSVQQGSMSDEELFRYLSKAIRDEEMYRRSDLNRNAVMGRGRAGVHVSHRTASPLLRGRGQGARSRRRAPSNSPLGGKPKVDEVN